MGRIVKKSYNRNGVLFPRKIGGPKAWGTRQTCPSPRRTSSCSIGCGRVVGRKSLEVHSKLAIWMDTARRPQAMDDFW